LFPIATWVLFGLSAFGMLAMGIELTCVWILRRRALPPTTRHPGFSILKPLCGLDDELVENLQSHVRIEYPGDFEILLGVRSEQDAAWAVARDFAAANPGRVKLVVQQGEPGHNPKVNQLISLTKEARFEILAVTDSNVRVPPSFLSEHAALLSNPKIGLSSHSFIGTGERRLGALLDNMTLASFVAPNVAAGYVAAKADQIIGKSLALRREVLAEVGGWHEVKDVLAEDQRLGMALRRMGLKTAICPTPVHNVQINQRYRQFFDRHARWSMIRFRVLMPAVLLEPLLNPIALVTLGVFAARFSPPSLIVWSAVTVLSISFTQAVAIILRGYGFKPWQLLLVPLRDWTFFIAWVRGAFMRRVSWRGNPLYVLAKTRLAEPDALARAKNIQRLGR
jgi:ceramide glucosyltransferase